MTQLDVLRTALSDRYRIDGELGQGGMATVYLAQDLRHDRRVAIKVLRPEVAAELAADRFLREITTTAQLQHPNIVPLFDSGQVTATGDEATRSAQTPLLYYVMPLIEGESLRSRLDREGRLPVAEAVRLVREIAEALQYAHELGILHRDLKPENILLSRGHAMLADFGIARAAIGGADRLTRTGVSLGTPAYMSPEQATGERDLSPASDVYGLGTILYELLTGSPPFTGPTVEAILVKRFTQDPPRPGALRGEIPSACDVAVTRAMAREPGQRFTTAQAFAEALDLDSAPTTAPGKSPATDRSLVVLPFVNQSPDPENEYFSDGLTEEIISDLASVKTLRVISRTSSMRLKGTTRDMRSIGRELGVRYALEGSVRKAGSALRITAQLVDTTTDARLWGEKYNGTMEDVFEVQERVAREIVAALGISLTSDEDRHLAQRPLDDPRAFELFLQARQELRRYATGPIELGEDLTRRAMSMVGEVPPLQALMAWAKVARVRAGLASDKSGLDEARIVAEQLVRNAPDQPFGHALLGFIGYECGTMPEAIEHLRAALQYEPNDADALFFVGICLAACGDIGSGRDVVDRLMATDPLSPLSWMLAGIMPWWEGDVALGLPKLERAAAIDPGNAIIHWSLGYARALVGEGEGAEREAAWLRDVAPTMPYTAQLTALVQAMRGEREAALRTLRDANGLDAHHKFHLAEAFSMAGDPARALALLEDAVNTGFHPASFIENHCPFLVPIRNAPEFAAIAADARRRTDDCRARAVRSPA